MTPISRAIQQGLEVERRDLPSQGELDRRTRELRYREAVDQRLLRLLIGLSVFGVSVLWLVADVTLTLAQGWGTLGGRPFKLDSTVIVAFLTTSTATVIGLFLVFLRWLYPSGTVPESSQRSGRGERAEGVPPAR
ncbi:hypothetical protein CVO96_15115 [Deinococcus koreensis]|uniref:Uncharacterized protein n=1 Tax=Deinococcus koreensis TaxID=2054903 RepID=A0A2K3V2V6_9DEIO|nr:hypothetical protein CVO96_15115 [Deinococcus koreensis]